MRLVAKVVDAPSVCGGKAFIICTEDGTQLPNQQGGLIRYACGEVAQVEVTFLVDGDKVSLA
jgi:hypothetical protein